MTRLSHRYTEALDYARIAHSEHCRKGTRIPYLYHLLGVSSLVLEYGGDEDQAIAGLLHDVVEDCGGHHQQEIEHRFGPGVAAIVAACTDGTAENKANAQDAEAKRADWWQRKVAYLDQLADKPANVLLVSGCDKLHNAQAILKDARAPSPGLKVFDRFTAGLDGTLRYYHSLSDLFSQNGTPMAAELAATVSAMHELAQVQPKPLV